MRMLDFAPLSRSTIGFDRLFDMLDQTSQSELDTNFSYYDIEKTGEDAYRVTLAVPGFTPDEISIESQPNMLLVSGRKSRNQDGQYLHRGLPMRNFEQRFSLADFVEVTSARLENGLLVIELKREVPEAMRPRRIEVGNGGTVRAAQQIEGERAA